MSVTTERVSLSHLGRVPADYVHEWRVGEPLEPLVTPRAVFKWYQVRRDGVLVPPELEAEARALVTAAAAGDDFDVSYGLNFVVLHQSTQHAFLLVCVWKGHQELWKRIAVKDFAAGTPLAWATWDPVDTPTACVWEMGPIFHERMVWHRYLFSERTDTDKQSWLTDTFTGTV